MGVGGVIICPAHTGVSVQTDSHSAPITNTVSVSHHTSLPGKLSWDYFRYDGVQLKLSCCYIECCYARFAEIKEYCIVFKLVMLVCSTTE